jgi:recombinational DNA repair protein (RecF pathway)
MIDGIVLKKMPYQERHLLVTLLLRHGFQKTFLFYGGLGGGRLQKGSVLELGHLIRFQPMAQTKKASGQLDRCKDWDCAWFHHHIRKNYRALAQLCFYLETLQKFSPIEEDSEFGLDTHRNLFAVLSNALVALDRLGAKPAEKDFHFHLAFFLGKMLMALGLCPPLDACVLSAAPLTLQSKVMLHPDQGGFGLTHPGTNDDTALLHFLADVSRTRYGDINPKDGINLTHAKKLFEFLCVQYNTNRHDFKTSEIFQAST